MVINTIQEMFRDAKTTMEKSLYLYIAMVGYLEKLDNLFKFEAHLEFYRRHMVDMLRIKFRMQR